MNKTGLYIQYCLTEENRPQVNVRVIPATDSTSAKMLPTDFKLDRVNA